MSKKVRRYKLFANLRPEAIPFLPDEVVSAIDYDALHAEAEALRAENAALQAKVVAQDRLIRQSGDWIESVRDEVLCHLANGTEHAVAIHEESHALYQTSASLIADIDAFLTATPAPEVQVEPTILQDEAFADEFSAWWESEGQYVRSGGGDYERTFAFEAWRYLMPKVRAAEQGERQEASTYVWNPSLPPT